LRFRGGGKDVFNVKEEERHPETLDGGSIIIGECSNLIGTSEGVGRGEDGGVERRGRGLEISPSMGACSGACSTASSDVV
jgi:hypothetical protein